MNYFELFELPFAPVVDKTLLSKKFIALQKKYHPDFYSQASEEEKEDMMQQSAEVNKAYNIFQHAERTIEYFLQQKNVITADEKYQLPPDFLMDMMDLNEALTEEDATSFDNRVSNFQSELNETVSGILAKTAAAGISDAEMQLLKAYYFKQKYLNRILDRLDD